MEEKKKKGAREISNKLGSCSRIGRPWKKRVLVTVDWMLHRSTQVDEWSFYRYLTHVARKIVGRIRTFGRYYHRCQRIGSLLVQCATPYFIKHMNFQ